MVYSVLTSLGAFLLTGKISAAIFGLAVGVILTRFFRSKAGDVIDKRGGVEDAKVIKRVCYSDGGAAAKAGDREYTLLVTYRNGERYRYVLRGDDALFFKLRPYIR